MSSTKIKEFMYMVRIALIVYTSTYIARLYLYMSQTKEEMCKSANKFNVRM